MASCPTCQAQVDLQSHACPACGTKLPAHDLRRLMGTIYAHVPHPHIELRKRHAPNGLAEVTVLPGPIKRFNKALGVTITEAVGTMWCAYIFAALALVSLPEAIKGGTAMLVAWIAQTFIQLVLLSIIMVGQKIAGEATDKRAIDTYLDAEAVLHEALEIQKHLAAQDAFLKTLIDELAAGRSAAELAQAGPPAADPLPGTV